MDTSIPTDTYIVDTHEGTGQAQVSYLSNGAGTDIILSVPMVTTGIIVDTHCFRNRISKTTC